MPKTLLDTDILSEVLRGVNPAVSRRAAAYLQEHGPFTTSVVTLVEVVSGLRRAARPERLADVLSRLKSMEILPLDVAAAELAGNIHADLTKRGRPIGLADVLIAAIAIQNSLTLCTGNTAHFAFVQDAGYRLAVEDWRRDPESAPGPNETASR